MNRFSRLATRTALALACLGIVGASAQTTDNDNPPPSMMHGMGGQPGGMHGMGGPPGAGMMGGMPMMSGCEGGAMGMGPGMDMGEHMEGRIAFLHAELKITNAQESAWAGVATAMRNNAASMRAAHGQMMAAMGGDSRDDQTLLQRMAAHERWLAARLDGTRALHAALTRLYGGLSAEQKQAADDLLAPQMGMGMGPGMGPRMMGPGGPDR